jgi:RimJ/RimL family protein N-acetyltransferase
MGVSAVAYRIETPRLVLRCWEPDDAPLMKDAVDSSIEHLLPWMPWARYEPQSLDEKLQLAREFRGQFDLGEQYVYGIFEPDESRALGGCGLHPRGGDGSLEIGYWIRADAIGQGLATEAAAVLTRVGFEHFGLDRVDLSVDPDNGRSRKIPVKLGFVEEGPAPAAEDRRRAAPGPADVLAAGGGTRRIAVPGVRIPRVRRARPRALSGTYV